MGALLIRCAYYRKETDIFQKEWTVESLDEWTDWACHATVDGVNTFIRDKTGDVRREIDEMGDVNLTS